MFHVCAYDRMFGRILTQASFPTEKEADRWALGLRRRGVMAWCEKGEANPFPTAADFLNPWEQAAARAEYTPEGRTVIVGGLNGRH